MREPALSKGTCITSLLTATEVTLREGGVVDDVSRGDGRSLIEGHGVQGAAAQHYASATKMATASVLRSWLGHSAASTTNKQHATARMATTSASDLSKE